MPGPEDVNPKNFKVKNIIFNDEEFSIAWGEWENEEMCLAMRWNGKGDDPGYPKLFRNPVWFILPKSLSLPITKAIAGMGKSSSKSILDVLSHLLTKS